MREWTRTQASVNGKLRGFTIVELLIVIVVIAILAAITIMAFNGIQTRARNAKISSDMEQLTKASISARVSTSQTLGQVTGNLYTAANCISKTDLAALPRTDTCWTTYANTLGRISVASGVDVRSIVDPWGRPYKIDENEGESGGCGQDLFATYSSGPYGGGDGLDHAVRVPLSGFSGCAT